MSPQNDDAMCCSNNCVDIIRDDGVNCLCCDYQFCGRCHNSHDHRGKIHESPFTKACETADVLHENLCCKCSRDLIEFGMMFEFSYIRRCSRNNEPINMLHVNYIYDTISNLALGGCQVLDNVVDISGEWICNHLNFTNDDLDSNNCMGPPEHVGEVINDDEFNDPSHGGLLGCGQCYACISGGSRPCLNDGFIENSERDISDYEDNQFDEEEPENEDAQVIGSYDEQEMLQDIVSILRDPEDDTDSDSDVEARVSPIDPVDDMIPQQQIGDLEVITFQPGQEVHGYRVQEDDWEPIVNELYHSWD